MLFVVKVVLCCLKFVLVSVLESVVFDLLEMVRLWFCLK